MPPKVSNINEMEYQQGQSRGLPFWSLDLSGSNLGVHVENIPPNATSSEHHYHTLEEEHVLVLEGSGTLHLGSNLYELKPGDHVCFAAGESEAHHIENRSAENFRFLVFGERKTGDVVFYPNHQKMLVKTKDSTLYSYSPAPTEN